VHVTELLSVLSAPAELGEVPPGAKVKATLAVTDRHGATIAIEVLAGGLVRRPGEALGLKLTASAAGSSSGPAARCASSSPGSRIRSPCR